MPDTLRDALNVRVQNLSDEAHQVVELAAVAGNRVEHELLASVAGGAAVDLDRGLREAIDASVLTADETGYGFRHALLAEAVYDDLLPGERVRLHAAFAAVLRKTGASAAELARHARESHDLTTAFEASVRAGDEAMLVAAPDEAVRHKMLDALGDLATAGAPILGRYVGHRAGHTLTNQLLRALCVHRARQPPCRLEAVGALDHLAQGLGHALHDAHGNAELPPDPRIGRGRPQRCLDRCRANSGQRNGPAG